MAQKTREKKRARPDSEVENIQRILVTGGSGYIGTHTCVELLNAGYHVTVIDNFCNSKPSALTRVEQITGKVIDLIETDIRNQDAVAQALVQSRATAVIHFAGLKAVGESANVPLDYYSNNVAGTLHLLQAMQECGVKTLVFSSSATVYGNPECLPFKETHRLLPTSPYGRTKLHIEWMLRDLHASNPQWNIAILRYFNPVGAHPSGLIGEDPQGVPNNLMPFLSQVAVGRRAHLSIFGRDYSTPDGTGVRDYIHVTDLALGHLRALAYLNRTVIKTPSSQTSGQCVELNLGTGKGYSVLELVKAFEIACGQPIPYQFKARRTGDIAEFYADPTLALQLLGWAPKFNLKQICEDSWRWQRMNPNGYVSQTALSAIKKLA